MDSIVFFENNWISRSKKLGGKNIEIRFLDENDVNYTYNNISL